jgi:hypothetical protein
VILDVTTLPGQSKVSFVGTLAGPARNDERETKGTTMAGTEETLGKLDAAVSRLADLSVEIGNQSGGHAQALAYAQAAKELAEAHAWLERAAQPH